VGEASSAIRRSDPPGGSVREAIPGGSEGIPTSEDVLARSDRYESRVEYHGEARRRPAPIGRESGRTLRWPPTRGAIVGFCDREANPLLLHNRPGYGQSTGAGHRPGSTRGSPNGERTGWRFRERATVRARQPIATRILFPDRGRCEAPPRFGGTLSSGRPEPSPNAIGAETSIGASCESPWEEDCASASVQSTGPARLVRLG
jgi:hypothetical protein